VRSAEPEPSGADLDPADDDAYDLVGRCSALGLGNLDTTRQARPTFPAVAVRHRPEVLLVVALAVVAWLQIAVSLPAVCDPHHRDDHALVLDVVDDPVVADPESHCAAGLT
jgi:hypothetical protein